jgi:hypothetical protein
MEDEEPWSRLSGKQRESAEQLLEEDDDKLGKNRKKEEGGGSSLSYGVDLVWTRLVGL